MSESIYLIYKFTSPSGKSYIGQTKNLAKRIYCHKSAQSECSLFQKAIQKYGWESFTQEILANHLTLEEANTCEEKYIKEHNTLAPNGYNLQTGGNNYRLSEDTKRKMSIIRKQLMTDEKREHLRQIRTGVSRSEETKARISAAKKNNTVISNDQRAQISKANKGRIPHNKGVSHSDETKNKISQNSANRGKPAHNKGRKRVKVLLLDHYHQEQLHDTSYHDYHTNRLSQNQTMQIDHSQHT